MRHAAEEVCPNALDDKQHQVDVDEVDEDIISGLYLAVHADGLHVTLAVVIERRTARVSA
jgi:hypothetical protein